MGLFVYECMIIGDSIEFDIVMGKFYGMKSVLVLIGFVKQGEQCLYMLDYVLDFIKDVIKLVEEGILI